jgi:uncharacterized protein (DUF58 family)
MRLPLYLTLAASILFVGLSHQSSAQSLRFGPGGVEIIPGQERPAPRDEIRDRMLGLRAACEDGDRHACVRLGIIIGEHRDRREQWRHEHPEVFSYER